MELKRIALVAAIASVAGLYGCTNEGDVANVDISSVVDNSVTGGDQIGGGDQGPTLTTSSCPTWAERALTQVEVDGAAVNVCELPSTILESRSLTNDTIWKMTGRVTVGNGNTEMDGAGALTSGDTLATPTLTIQAGTQVQAATNTFANLLITRGSKIDARGTAAAPIVFSSDDADLVGSGEWGGIIIHGFGEHNRCYTAIDTAATSCNIDAEGESGFAGGFDNSDSSGTLQYIVVTEGGYEFAPGDEINGISFVAVGSGTVVEHIQVDNNADDGVEYYGGAVNTKYLVVTGAGDDSVDWDEGFQGNLQYVLVKQNDNSNGNTIEADTEGTTFFNSAPFVMNATFIGSSSAASQLHRMKASTGGFIVNSVLDGAGASSVCAQFDGAGALANLNNATQYINIVADCVTFQEDRATGVAPTTPLDETTVSVIADVALDSAYATVATEASLSAAIDLTPFANTVAGGLGDDLTADTDFLEATDYIGAVAPGTAAADAWWAGWTLDGTL